MIIPSSLWLSTTDMHGRPVLMSPRLSWSHGRAVHPVDDSVDSKKRMIMGLMYWRSSADDNIYAHPLPWVPILDVESRKVRPLSKSDCKTLVCLPEGERWL
jgi:Cu2+-containing amine oxidase